MIGMDCGRDITPCGTPYTQLQRTTWAGQAEESELQWIYGNRAYEIGRKCMSSAEMGILIAELAESFGPR